MQDFSHAVVIEGDCPVPFADVTAFVAPATGGRLLVRRKSDQPSREREAMDALEALLSQPGGLESILGRLIGPGLGEFALQQPELVEQERRKAFAQLAELRSRPVAKQRMRWAVADTYRGIERAQLVVVNIRDHTEKDNGEALLAEVARLRKDDTQRRCGLHRCHGPAGQPSPHHRRRRQPHPTHRPRHEESTRTHWPIPFPPLPPPLLGIHRDRAAVARTTRRGECGITGRRAQGVTGGLGSRPKVGRGPVAQLLKPRVDSCSVRCGTGRFAGPGWATDRAAIRRRDDRLDRLGAEHGTSDLRPATGRDDG